ncbi:CgeB family protein [Rhizosaccharibacter radicis]|uniref:Glycosyltransferase n=1 Tax=Rhizosaccharibacter radicis TaxID=2782605 RepID=A0ABT1VZC9_9PROT|nr:glycosyltransferase [Acetobacteraceae bacterium KSS12]
MKLVVLGLSLSSSWGNGHATTFRALLRFFAARGHEVLFLERDVPWYRDNRDLPSPDFCRLRFYDALADLDGFRPDIEGADAVLVGSYVPDGIAVAERVWRWARGVVAFYDIDTPVTLAALRRGDCTYLSRDTIAGFDLYLSFTAGPTLGVLEREWGARAARGFYCSVDPERYAPAGTGPRWDLGYLGTWSADRQPTVERLLIEPARRAPHRRFVVAGPQYPADISWPANVERIEHLPPEEHASFYSGCRWTLNVTRADMIRAGWSPSVRLFEAGACGSAIVSDRWDGIEDVLTPGEEIVLADSAEDVLAVLDWPEERRAALGRAARERVLAAHTASHRAERLEALLLGAAERPGSASRSPSRPAPESGG